MGVGEQADDLASEDQAGQNRQQEPDAIAMHVQELAYGGRQVELGGK